MSRASTATTSRSCRDPVRAAAGFRRDIAALAWATAAALAASAALAALLVAVGDAPVLYFLGRSA